MDNVTNARQCLQCGQQILGESTSGDYCPDCASQARHELTLSAQLCRLSARLRSPLARLPLVTLSLIAINIAVYSVIAANPVSGAGRWLEATLDMNSTGVAHGQWWRLLTYAFLHVWSLHLISNMVFLFLAGWIAEKLLGHLTLLFLWLATGIAGGIAELLVARAAFTVLGASGVLFGLVGALLVTALFREIPLSKRTRHWRVAWTAAFILIDLLGRWLVLHGLNPGHIGGLMAGLLLGLVVPVEPNRRLARNLVSLCVTVFVLAPVAVIAKNRQAVWVDLDEIVMASGFTPDRSSIPKLEEIVARHPEILQAHLLLARALQGDHRTDDAIREYRYIIQKQPRHLDAWFGLGFSFMDAKWYQEAIDTFSHCLQIVSDNSAEGREQAYGRDPFTAYQGLASSYESLGRIDDAAAEYIEFLRLFPDSKHKEFAAEEVDRLQHLRQRPAKPAAHGSEKPQ